MQKFIQYVLKNWHYLLFIFLLIVINFLCLYDHIMNHNFTVLFKSALIVFSVFAPIILCFIVKKLIKQQKALQHIFLTIAVPLGCLYMIVLPMAGTPDEIAHYYRSYEISMGHITSKVEGEAGGRDFPVAISSIFDQMKLDLTNIKYRDVLDSFRIRTDNSVTQFTNFTSSALYSPLCYLPQATGILVARLLHLPTAFTFYFGRIFNFIAFLAIVYFSIKWLPIKKISMISILFLPSVFQAAISLSPDALTIAISFALISFTFYMRYIKKGKMTNREFTIMSILALFISMLKIVYLPICFLLFLIPKERFYSHREKYMKLGLLLMGIVGLNLGWLMYSSRFLIETNPGVNAVAQLEFILSSPISYVKILFDTLSTYYFVYLTTALGAQLGWLTINLNQSYVFSYFILLIFIFLTDQEKTRKKLQEFEKWWIFLLCCGIVLLIFTSLYIQWNAVRSELISGVQGRYFLPVVLLAVLLIDNHIKYNNRSNIKYYFSFAVFFNLYAIMECFLYHL